MLRQDLDGHFAAQPCVPGAVHFAHAAGSQRGHNLERSEFRPGNKRHERGIITWKRPCPPQFDRFRRANPSLELAGLYARMWPAMPVVEKPQLLSAEEIGRTLSRLAHEIVENSGGAKDLALIGVRRRGVPLSERLASQIRSFAKVEVPVGTLDITLYRDDLSTVGSHPVVQSTQIEFPVDNRDLVIVDDVLYTGRTIRAAMNGLFDLGRPRRIQLCVLIDRGHRELPVEASFVGRQIQTSDSEIVEVRLREIDGEERVMLVDRVS
jgi:pyrimidine operon attenuation protein/uracil phosphoribosyltransferase